MSQAALRKRKRNRFPDFNYSSSGYYFVTICTKEHRCLFGEVRDGVVRLNEYGVIASNYFHKIPSHYNDVKIDGFIVMPNHIHGIIVIDRSLNNVGTEHCSVPTNSYGLLSKIIMSYKNVVIKEIHNIGNYSFHWQRSFYDHVIRSDKSLQKIREYIRFNPNKWKKDEYYKV